MSGWLYQPFASGARSAVAVAEGAVLSSLIVTLLAVSSGPFWAEHVSFVPAVPAVNVTVSQPDDEVSPTTCQSIVTLLRYQPFSPSVPVIVRVISGGRKDAPRSQRRSGARRKGHEDGKRAESEEATNQSPPLAQERRPHNHADSLSATFESTARLLTCNKGVNLRGNLPFPAVPGGPREGPPGCRLSPGSRPRGASGAGGARTTCRTRRAPPRRRSRRRPGRPACASGAATLLDPVRVVSASASSSAPTMACGSQCRVPFFAEPPIQGATARARPVAASSARCAFIGMTRRTARSWSLSAAATAPVTPATLGGSEADLPSFIRKSSGASASAGAMP